MVSAGVWFGWWLCMSNMGGNSSFYCLPMHDIIACKTVEKFDHYSYCINNLTGEVK